MKKISRLHFAHLPTPFEELPRLSKVLNGPRLFVKRDDQTGLAFGGNKTRKLEYLLADARARGSRTLITTGALQSNHCRQTAAAAARHGLDCILVLSVSDLKTKMPLSNGTVEQKNEAPKSPPQKYTGNLLLDTLLGAEIVWTSGQERDLVLQQTFQKAQDDDRKPYLIPYGGSNTLGATAYLNAIKELLDQVRQSANSLSEPDWIVFPSSSGGTQAGLVLGASIFGYEGQILGISVDETAAVLQDRVAKLATETAGFLGESVQYGPDDILVNDRFLGEGYGIMGDLEKEAVHMFASSEGLILDPVYTGRAAGAMISLIRDGFFTRDKTILFWHTGGTPAVFADKYQEMV